MACPKCFSSEFPIESAINALHFECFKMAWPIRESTIWWHKDDYWFERVARISDHRFLAHLLEQGVVFRDWWILHGCVERGIPECVELLCMAGLDLNHRSIYTTLTPFEIACRAGRFDNMHVLLDYGASVSSALTMGVGRGPFPEAFQARSRCLNSACILYGILTKRRQKAGLRDLAKQIAYHIWETRKNVDLWNIK
jgi:hypothetical protein